MATKIEIIGVEPPCYRCKETKENTDKAVAKLLKEGHKISVTKLNVLDKTTMERFGIVRTPALAVNGVIKIMGKIPDPGGIERIIRKDL
jgi:hypothetical protein